jgi:hypothetical protein
MTSVASEVLFALPLCDCEDTPCVHELGALEDETQSLRKDNAVVHLPDDLNPPRAAPRGSAAPPRSPSPRSSGCRRGASPRVRQVEGNDVYAHVEAEFAFPCVHGCRAALAERSALSSSADSSWISPTWGHVVAVRLGTSGVGRQSQTQRFWLRLVNTRTRMRWSARVAVMNTADPCMSAIVHHRCTEAPNGELVRVPPELLSALSLCGHFCELFNLFLTHP